MAITSFDKVPRSQFVRRMIGPGLIALVFLFFTVGVVATSPAFETPRGPSAVVPFWVATFQHYHRLFVSIHQLPEICISGATVNDFEANQCNDYWNTIIKTGILGLLPFAAVGLLYFLCLGNITGIYKWSKSKINKGKAAFGGTVTDPPGGQPDFFSWFCCLRPVMIELTNKKQMKVYVSTADSMPRPGDTLAVFGPKRAWGGKRHVAVVYAPHVSVIRGE